MAEWEREEQWSDSAEELLSKWRDVARGLACEHELAGQSLRALHQRWALPGALIPAVVAPLTALSSEASSWVHYGEALVLMAGGVCGVVSTFFAFSARSERHFAFSARYADLVTDIDAELSRARHNRQAVDTFQLRCQMVFDALNKAAPDL